MVEKDKGLVCFGINDESLIYITSYKPSNLICSCPTKGSNSWQFFCFGIRILSLSSGWMVQLELDEFYLESPSIFKPEIMLLGHEFEQGSSDRQKSVQDFQNFVGPVRSQVLKFFLILVRFEVSNY